MQKQKLQPLPVASESPIDQESDPIVLKMVFYINENYMHNISLETAAQHFGYSREYFSKIFKRTVGKNFLSFLSAVRTEKAIELLSDEFIALHPHIRICGVMGMASLTDDEAKIRAEFKAIKATFERLRDEVFDGCDYFCEVSMGMSGDYPIAIEEGATIVRIGSSIFGNRNY